MQKAPYKNTKQPGRLGNQLGNTDSYPEPAANKDLTSDPFWVLVFTGKGDKLLFWRSHNFSYQKVHLAAEASFLTKIFIKTGMFPRNLSVVVNQHFLIKSSMPQNNSQPDQIRVAVIRNPFLCYSNETSRTLTHTVCLLGFMPPYLSIVSKTSLKFQLVKILVSIPQTITVY